MHADLVHVNMVVCVATIQKALNADAMSSSMKDGRAPVGIMQLQTGILQFPQTHTCLLTLFVMKSGLFRAVGYNHLINFLARSASPGFHLRHHVTRSAETKRHRSWW